MKSMQAADAVTLSPTPSDGIAGSGTAQPNQSRRLIFVNRYFYPDVSATSQMLSDLVRSLGHQGDELHVICSRQLYTDAAARLAPRDRIGPVAIHRTWSSRFGRDRLLGRAWDYASFFLTSTLTLLLLARRRDVIIAMTDPPLMSVCAALVARLKGARLVNWLQDVFPEVAVKLDALQLPQSVIHALTRARNWSLRVADRNVVLGLSMQHVVTGLRVPRSRQYIIENWADADRLTPKAAQSSELRGELSAERRFIVQYSGNMGRAHDYETLLGAALELRDEPVWLFLFVGGGAHMQRLRDAAQREGLSNLRFLPHQPRERLQDCLAAADVHISCLRPALEGLIIPSKLYGILAAGRPVIVIGDPDGEQARIVRGAGCGRVVACGDSRGMVDELRRIRSDPEWLHQAGSNARHLFEQRYTLATATRKWRLALDALPR